MVLQYFTESMVDLHGRVASTFGSHKVMVTMYLNRSEGSKGGVNVPIERKETKSNTACQDQQTRDLFSFWVGKGP
jgi:hypothetical protein